jgi:archaellum component FlaC
MTEGLDGAAGALARIEDLLGRIAADLAETKGRTEGLGTTLAEMARKVERIENQVARLERRGRF